MAYLLNDVGADLEYCREVVCVRAREVPSTSPEEEDGCLYLVPKSRAGSRGPGYLAFSFLSTLTNPAARLQTSTPILLRYANFTICRVAHSPSGHYPYLWKTEMTLTRRIVAQKMLRKMQVAAVA